jgi:protein-tyrosine phosphatase
MVCLGNICRSPIADGLLRRKVKENNLNILVDSAGTATYHIGKAPDSRMCSTAEEFGTNIKSLVARKFTINDFDDFDIIYAMDESNRQNILSLARNKIDREKVRLILNELDSNSNLSVPDPYYGSLEDFKAVYELVEKVTSVIITKIKNGEIR